MTVGQLQSVLLNFTLVRCNPSVPDIFTERISNHIIEEVQFAVSQNDAESMFAQSAKSSLWCFDKLRYHKASLSLVEKLLKFNNDRLNIDILECSLSHTPLCSQSVTSLVRSAGSLTGYNDRWVDCSRVLLSLCHLHRGLDPRTKNLLITTVKNIIKLNTTPTTLPTLYSNHTTRIVDAVSQFGKDWPAVVSLATLRLLVNASLAGEVPYLTEKLFQALARLDVSKDDLGMRVTDTSEDQLHVRLSPPSNLDCSFVCNRQRLLWGLTKVGFDISFVNITPLLDDLSLDTSYLLWAVYHKGGNKQARLCISSLASRDVNTIPSSGQLLHACLALCRRFAIELDEPILRFIISFKSCFLTPIEKRDVLKLLLALDVSEDIQKMLIRGKTADPAPEDRTPTKIKELPTGCVAHDVDSSTITMVASRIVDLRDSDHIQKAVLNLASRLQGSRSKLSLDGQAVVALARLCSRVRDVVPENVKKSVRDLLTIVSETALVSQRAEYSLRCISSVVDAIGADDRVYSGFVTRKVLKAIDIPKHTTQIDSEKFGKAATHLFYLLGMKRSSPVPKNDILIRNLGLFSLSHNKQLRKDPRLLHSFLKSIEKLYPEGTDSDKLVKEICSQLATHAKGKDTIVKLSWLIWMPDVLVMFKKRRWNLPRSLVFALQTSTMIHIKGNQLKLTVEAVKALSILVANNFTSSQLVSEVKTLASNPSAEVAVSCTPSDVFTLFPSILPPRVIISYIDAHISQSPSSLTPILKHVNKTRGSIELNQVIEHVVMSHDVPVSVLPKMQQKYTGVNDLVLAMLRPEYSHL
eukprot:TRINITY_DN5651_c2_g1_i1.p1 TRINITY_DN5651_c2_g1~~TRINITY_DN5651_c2_g1_i1.p1  ORF type:complete len:921 (+),score=124.05 TRINITY_DN5651_c2_g1_i1:345-2765(+)